MLALLLMQAVAGPPAPREDRPAAATLPAAPCPPADDGDVVVCARRNDPPRLVKLPEEPPSRSAQDRMTFRLPGHATGNVHAFQHDMPGATSQGGAVTLRLPFGKGTKE